MTNRWIAASRESLTENNQSTRVQIMALPTIFGPTWEDFIANWCLGNPPPGERDNIEKSLSTLFRLCPEKVEALAQTPMRGLLLVSPAIHTGDVLSACESLNGFEKVVGRLKSGERAAYSELIFAARLVKAGHEFRQPPRVFPGGAAISLSNTRRKLCGANGGPCQVERSAGCGANRTRIAITQPTTVGQSG